MLFHTRPNYIQAFRMGIDNRPDWFQDKVSTGEITTQVVDGEVDNGPFEFRKTWCTIKVKDSKEPLVGNYGDFIVKFRDGRIEPFRPEIFYYLFKESK